MYQSKKIPYAQPSAPVFEAWCQRCGGVASEANGPLVSWGAGYTCGACRGESPPRPVATSAGSYVTAADIEAQRAWRCSCGVINGERCTETCPEALARLAQWEATHCGARPSGRVLSRFCALDGFGIEMHGTVATGERCSLDKDHAGDHEDWERATQWPPSPAEERRAREASLVALVNAVPEGLDPIGWRAAVLAMAEAGGEQKGTKTAVEWMTQQRNDLVDTLLIVHTAVTTGRAWLYIRWSAACRAYACALTPHKAPPPERRIARGRVIVVDRDDE